MIFLYGGKQLSCLIWNYYELTLDWERNGETLFHKEW